MYKYLKANRTDKITMKDTWNFRNAKLITMQQILSTQGFLI